METPDITPVQKLSAAGLALLGAILTLVNVMEWADIGALEGSAITGVYTAFAAFALLADSQIRKGRALNYAAIVAHKAESAAERPVLVQNFGSDPGGSSAR